MRNTFSIILTTALALTASNILYAHGAGHFSGKCDGEPGTQKQEGYVEYEDVCYRVEFFCSVGLDNGIDPGGPRPHALDVWYDGDGLEYLFHVVLDENPCVSAGMNPLPGATDKMSYSCDFEDGDRASFLIHQVNAKHCPENGD